MNGSSPEAGAAAIPPFCCNASQFSPIAPSLSFGTGQAKKAASRKAINAAQ